MKKTSTTRDLRRFLLSILFLFSTMGLSAQQKMGDNLGNHKATTDLNMNLKNVVDAAGLVIGSATFTNTSVILDLISATKAMVMPRLTDIKLLPVADVIDGMMAFDVLTKKFYVRENGAWSTFGSFALQPAQILLGDSLGVAKAVQMEGDITIGFHPADSLVARKDKKYKTRISNRSVKLNMLYTDTLTDINKVYTTGLSGIPELINKNDLSLPKYTLVARDSILSPANNMVIFNTDTRTLQVYDINIPAWVNTGSAAASNFPTVSTVISSATSTKPDTAFAGGTIINPGTLPVTSRGVCWSLTINPTTANFVTSEGAGAGSFSSTLYGLKPSTLYYVRAYAVNALGVTYGNQVNITTNIAGLPIVESTVTVSDITNSTATSGGSVTNDRGAAVTVHGVVWNNTGSPVVSNPKTTDGPGIGTFGSSLTDLSASTTYYVRAYATNSSGTTYGPQKSFTTLAVTVPQVSTKLATQTANSAIVRGSVLGTGGAPVTSRGVYYSSSSTVPTSANSVVLSGSGTGDFNGAVSGLTQNTLYYFRAFAINSSGTGYGSVSSFVANGLPVFAATSINTSSVTATSINLSGSLSSDGGDSTTTKGFVYSTASNPTLSNSKIDKGLGVAGYIDVLSGLTSGVTYYVRTYATNTFGTVYGAQVSFTTSGSKTFDFNGSLSNTFTSGSVPFSVPNGVTSVNLKCYGAQGAGGDGGQGGYAEGQLAVTPGQVLNIFVGGPGTIPNGSAASSYPGGWNGGGTGYGVGGNGGSGGGATDIRIGGIALSNRVIVAGGGGGQGLASGGSFAGGKGGGDLGGDGFSPNGYTFFGKGGSQASGGTGGTAYSGGSTMNGTLGIGGAAGTANSHNGGGGGGYFGGGGGDAAGGGGGSGMVNRNLSYIMTNTILSQGGNLGAGKVIITW